MILIHNYDIVFNLFSIKFQGIKAALQLPAPVKADALIAIH